MRVSTKARYAVSALAEMALTFREDDLPLSLKDIADRQELPLAYMEQIFLKLRKAGLLKSERGAYGGYVLARSPQMIRISDIIFAVDRPMRATRCDRHVAKGCMSTGKRCLTHDLWEGLDAAIDRYFKKMTLFDLVTKETEAHKPENAHSASFCAVTGG